MAESLLAILDSYDYHTLLRIAGFSGITTTRSGGRRLHKTTLISVMQKELTDPHRTRKALSVLDPLERRVLDRLLLCEGDVPTAWLREVLVSENILQPGPRELHLRVPPDGNPVRFEASGFDAVIANLTLHGLVFSIEKRPNLKKAKTQFGPRSHLTIPEPLRAHLPQPSLPPVDWGCGNPPGAMEEVSTVLAQRDLFIYWSYARSHQITLTRKGLVPKRVLRLIGKQLLIPDHLLAGAPDERRSPRLDFARHLHLELALLVNKRGRLCYPSSGTHVPPFWEQPLEVRTLACLNAWTHMSSWDVLVHLDRPTIDFDLSHAREVLVQQLRLLQPGVWISSDLFLRRLRMVAPRLLFRARMENYVEGSMTEGSRWVAEMRATFVGGALSGPLHWLGLLDTHTDEGRLLAFRLTGSGARALGITPITDGEPVEAKIVVQSNFHIFALGPISEGKLAKLEMFADRVKADRSAFEYVLSRESLYGGREIGLPISAILTFLRQNSSTAVPQNVLRTLQQWGEQLQRIVFHRGVTVCETAEPALLDRLGEDTSLQSHLGRQLTSTVTLAKQGHGSALLDALLQRGMLPALSPGNDPHTARVQATPEGELRPFHDGPDVQLRARLRQLAEEREGRFFLTEAAVARALDRGMTVSQYIEQIVALHRGPLPAHLELRVKAWSHYYGEASLKEVVLLEVKDANIAEELASDPELAPLVSRLTHDSGGRLLVVSPDDADKARDLLHKRGVELT